MNTSGKILAAVAAGIAAGAVLGILFAPDKGTETRRKISEQGKKMTDGIKMKINKGKEKFDELKERGKEKFDDLKERFEHKKNEKAEEFA